jgi:hypothetical protein
MNSIDLLNSNDYNRGYDDGYKDGFRGKAKNFTKSGMSLKYALWNSFAIDTYNQGYNDGYQKGCADKNSKPQSQTVTNTGNSFNTQNNMMEMNLEVQKQRISDLKAQLDLMAGRVEVLKQDLNGQLDRALENGLPLEVYQRYKAHYLSSLYNGLDTLVNRVMRDDMGYLTDVQVHIQEAINRQ